jgi:hypothetical protein
MCCWLSPVLSAGAAALKLQTIMALTALQAGKKVAMVVQVCGLGFRRPSPPHSSQHAAIYLRCALILCCVLCVLWHAVLHPR